jgi:hypothetical protein
VAAFLLFAMQGQMFRQQWSWPYETHIAFDYVEQLREFVQDFFARTKIPIFINRFESGSKFPEPSFFLIMVFYFNDFKNTSIFT